MSVFAGPMIEPFGPDPEGSIIITENGRFAALLDSFMGYAGRYAVEGDTVTTLDLCWNDVFTGPAAR